MAHRAAAGVLAVLARALGVAAAMAVIRAATVQTQPQIQGPAAAVEVDTPRHNMAARAPLGPGVSTVVCVMASMVETVARGSLLLLLHGTKHTQCLHVLATPV